MRHNQKSGAAMSINVGFIGAGAIGRPMAERLIETSCALTICDVNPAVLAALAALGADTTAEPRDCATAEIIVVMVATDAQAHEVVLGPRGLIHGIDPKRPPLVVLASTLLPATVEAIADQAGKSRVAVIDAPVSGGVVRAREGKLTIMAGGAPADLERAAPVLNRLATEVHHCGVLGAGAATKIVNNIMGVASTFLMTEAMQIAGAAGLDRRRMASIMESSSGRNFGTQDWQAFRTLLGRYGHDVQAAKANVDVCRKDLHHALAMAAAAGIAAPFVQAMSAAADSSTYADIADRWKSLGT